MKAIVSIGALLACLFVGPAFADNPISLLSNDDSSNAAKVTFDGDQNKLSITQTFDGLGGRNTIGIAITGDLNGGPLGAAFSGLPATLGLVPGSLTQSGHDNFMQLAINGDGNLFAAIQQGSQNSLTGTIRGNNNQAAVAQYGSGNALTFTQNGNGNSLTVTQRSW